TGHRETPLPRIDADTMLASTRPVNSTDLLAQHGLRPTVRGLPSSPSSTTLDRYRPARSLHVTDPRPGCRAITSPRLAHRGPASRWLTGSRASAPVTAGRPIVHESANRRGHLVGHRCGA